MKDTVKAGSYVQIHKTILHPEERTAKIPEDTKRVPFEMWVKGFLLKDAQPGGDATVKTITGREVSGTLVEANPAYKYGFGDTFIPELLQVGISLRKLAREPQE